MRKGELDTIIASMDLVESRHWRRNFEKAEMANARAKAYCGILIKGLRKIGVKVDDRTNESVYYPPDDKINIPSANLLGGYIFKLQTLVHETAHASGSKDRLNRKGIIKDYDKNDAVYAYEEVIAELAAILFMERRAFWIDLNSYYYLNSWVERVDGDAQGVLKRASRHSEKALDWIDTLMRD